jgi:hypothetical protein
MTIEIIRALETLLTSAPGQFKSHYLGAVEDAIVELDEAAAATLVPGNQSGEMPMDVYRDYCAEAGDE